MKKLNVLFAVMMIAAAMLCMAVFAGCATQKAMNAPDWIDELAPQDELWGIGYAKLQNEGLARETALSRARRDVGAQLSALAQSMLTDYARESGTLNDTASIQSIERIAQELINVNLSGATPSAQKRMDDGTWWIRVSLKKADADKVVNDVFTTEASRYADFKAAEAAKLMQERINQTQSRPTPRSED